MTTKQAFENSGVEVGILLVPGVVGVPVSVFVPSGKIHLGGSGRDYCCTGWHPPLVKLFRGRFFQGT